MKALSERQVARSLVRVGKFVKVRATVELTPIGLLSIGAMVSGILLSTSVLVATAVRESRRAD
ncbi:hypothetical protein NS277_13550 [Novosphingobium barchaimii]|nr:hypothetical protein NS277_13550 [Novosphingobium barchaimii]